MKQISGLTEILVTLSKQVVAEGRAKIIDDTEIEVDSLDKEPERKKAFGPPDCGS